MVSYASPASAVKGSNSTRNRPSGLRVKTNVSGGAATDGKARVIALTDWRGTASTIPSSDAATKKSPAIHGDKHGPEECDGPYASVAPGMEKPPSGHVQYRRPREKQAPWETILSAPAGQAPSSPPSTPEIDSEIDSEEVALVRLKRVSPLVMKVNGEDIPLPNRFYLEVVPVDPGATCDKQQPRAVLGKLRPIKASTSCRRMPSDGFYNLLDHLRETVDRDQGGSSGATTASTNEPRRPGRVAFADGNGSSNSISSAAPVIEDNADQPRRRLPSDEETRFQGMLSRLQKKAQPPPPTERPSILPTSSGRINDPAIVAIKVKETAESGTQDKPAGEAPKHEIHYKRIGARELFGSLGIPSTNGCPNGGSVVESTRGRSTEDSPTKRLNPAAAEFRSTMRDEDLPCFSPKKVTRPPLSNIFPEAMAKHTPAQPGIPLGDALPAGLPQQTAEMPVEGKLAFDLASLSGAFPGALPTIDSLLRPMVTPLPFTSTLPATISPASHPLLNHYGTVPSATASNTPVGVPHLSLPTAASLTNTFPLASGVAGTTAGLLAAAATAAAPCVPEPRLSQPSSQPQQPQQQQQQQQQQQPSQPLAGLSDKIINRPYFPVTQKPRDHDPVKQQLYEAYLEWRKANEPGYHLKCKMRQAQRVVRQFQKQQQQQQQKEKEKSAGSSDGGDHAAWKAIAEKARAAVGMAAAAAAAEKRIREEKVREELRAKVMRRKCVALAVTSSSEGEDGNI